MEMSPTKRLEVQIRESENRREKSKKKKKKGNRRKRRGGEGIKGKTSEKANILDLRKKRS